ncbi:MAG: imidazole glycerol phosphate synthase subunit HisH [Abditibacteriales bacterium]|nr:imidazole glycerol phosphate synthase subunit HisH [Abditibacteriales bacterium]MDW8365776.1 imidazole glycerol phosphate synthase subunit HisH [Abditibacteriales bacterium]
MIAIIDYGMGNLRSVEKALQHLGYECKITRDPLEVARADKVILPGVGAFGAAMANLQAAGLIEVTKDAVASGKPFLGICLGLQLLFTESEEMGRHEGLGIFAGKVVRFPEAMPLDVQGLPLRVPHIGWNSLNLKRPAPVLRDVPDGARVYFVHSYFPVPEDPDIIAATSEHGVEFTCVVWKDNVCATQFHPEKSGAVGLQMLKNFAEQ